MANQVLIKVKYVLYDEDINILVIYVMNNKFKAFMFKQYVHIVKQDL